MIGYRSTFTKGWVAHGVALALIMGCAWGTLAPAAVAQSAGWEVVPGGLRQVSADGQTVWGVNDAGGIYRRPADGSGAWEKVCCSLSHVSATGAGWVWGVQAQNSIWKCKKPCAANGSGWQRVDGAAVRVSADETTVWAVNAAGEIYRRPVDGSGRWEKVCCSLSDVSASGDGWVWGVQAHGSIWKCKKPCAANGSGWQQVDGAAKSICAGGEHVWALNAAGEVFRRPVDGSGSWEQVPGELSSLAVSDAGWLWGTDAQSMIYRARRDDAGSDTTGDVVQAEAVIPPVCPEGQAPGANGGCVTEVYFLAMENLTVEEAQRMSLENGFQLASANQVRDAWEKLGLDVYAYGMLADGSFAVPVQRNHSNFAKGHNIGATGGNQGFFYTLGCARGYELGADGTCRSADLPDAPVASAGGISQVVTEGDIVFRQSSLRTWTAFDPNAAPGQRASHFYETGRTAESISLRDFSGETVVTIDLATNRLVFRYGEARTESLDVRSATDPVDRANWPETPSIHPTTSSVTRIFFGDDTRTSGTAIWGSLQKVEDAKWVVLDEADLFIQEMAQTAIDAERITLRSDNGSTMRVSFSDRTVRMVSTATPADNDLVGGTGDTQGAARIVATEGGPLPSHWGPEQNRLIAQQDAAANRQYYLKSPLSERDLNAVMQWIGGEVSASSVDYCYRNSEPRPTYSWQDGDPYLPDYNGLIARCEADFGSGKCEQKGLHVYPRCADGMYGDGPICWQHCPTLAQVMERGQNTKFDCGIGCAASRDVCAMTISDMVFAPVNMALAIVTLGLSNAGAQAAKQTAGVGAQAASSSVGLSQGVTQTALGSDKWARLSAALAKAEEISDQVIGAKDKIEYLIANVENFDTEVSRWTAEYDHNFGDLTSYRIESIIDRAFPDPDDASYIKQKYGQYHLTAMTAADGWRIWRAVATAASIEPLGIVATVDAFAQPMCRDASVPFPSVRVLARAERGDPDPLIQSVR